MDYKSNACRAPKCTRCRNHGVASDLRGHKHKCFFRNCSCQKCLISSDKQRATADRIALFRQQVREAQETDRKEVISLHRIKTDHQTENEVATENLSLDDMERLTTFHMQKDNIPDLLSRQIDYRTKNIQVLKYIFPFYDIETLCAIADSCHNDILQTVLKISSAIITQKHRVNSSNEVFSPKPHLLSPASLASDRCCESPYCPVKSYLALRRRDSVVTPSTANTLKKFTFNDEEILNSKRMKLSPKEHSIIEKINESPYCSSCKRLGNNGDKFCPLCGVLF